MKETKNAKEDKYISRKNDEEQSQMKNRVRRQSAKGMKKKKQ